MKHFYKLGSNEIQAITAMNSIMLRQSALTPATQDGVKWLRLRDTESDTSKPPVFPFLKQWGIQLVAGANGTALGGMVLLRIEVGMKVPLSAGAPDYQSYIIALHAAGPGATLLAGDEAIDLRTGEVWWCDLRSEAYLFNKSTDEVFMMLVDVRVDP